jgi:hemerythrin-like domain-containing protein
MLRDRNLVPLSRQHQHMLALCVRIDRAMPIGNGDLAGWQTETTQIFQSEISIHFAAEELVVFPAARKFAELIPLVDELLADHAVLREGFAQAESRTMSATELAEFAQRMSDHIRKEERRLFERMQELMNPVELELLGRHLEEALKDASQVCQLPAAGTRPL